MANIIKNNSKEYTESNNNYIYTVTVTDRNLKNIIAKTASTINVPDGTTSLYNYEFTGNSSLNKVTLPASITSGSSYAFYNCSKLITAGPTGGDYNIEYPWTTSIPSYAFSYATYLENITFPSTLVSIGLRAFEQCNYLNSITIDGNVTLGNLVFYGCDNLNDVTVKTTKFGTQVFYDCPKLITAGPIGGDYNIKFSWISEIPKYAFYYANYLQSITFPDGVTKINDGGFYHCTELVLTAIPNTVTEICAGAFQECSSIKTLELSNNLTTIGQGAFAYCSALTDIEIPASVKSIGPLAFNYCKALKNVTIYDSIESIGSNAFSSCNALIYNKYENSKYLGNSSNNYVVLVSDSNANETVIINSATRIIYSNAFSSNKYVTSAVIPESVVEIGSYAFYNRTTLTSLVIKNKNISSSNSSYIFWNCPIEYYTGPATLFKSNNFTKIVFKEMTLTAGESIPASMLAGCSSIYSLTLPDELVTIYATAFYNCTALLSLSIPASVTTIMANALQIGSTTSKATITMLGTTPPTIETTTFAAAKLNKIIVPAGCGELYKTTGNWTLFAEYIEEAE